MTLTTLDIILLLCFLPAIWHGVSKGFVRQIVGIAGLFFGAWLGSRYCVPLGHSLAAHLSDSQPGLVNVVCFLVIFFATLLVTGLLGKLISRILKFATLGGLDRLFGVIFGIFKAALLMAILVGIFDGINGKLDIADKDTLNRSEVYGYLKDFGSRFFPFLKGLITNGKA